MDCSQPVGLPNCIEYSDRLANSANIEVRSPLQCHYSVLTKKWRWLCVSILPLLTWDNLSQKQYLCHNLVAIVTCVSRAFRTHNPSISISPVTKWMRQHTLFANKSMLSALQAVFTRVFSIQLQFHSSKPIFFYYTTAFTRTAFHIGAEQRQTLPTFMEPNCWQHPRDNQILFNRHSHLRSSVWKTYISFNPDQFMSRTKRPVFRFFLFGTLSLPIKGVCAIILRGG